MSANFLPKSLHTVRILTAVARHVNPRRVAAGATVDAVITAAAIIGYPNADARDPLIQKAAAQLAAGK